MICLVTINEPIPVTYYMAQIELRASFETLFPCDCKKEGDTHSWPFHSCARASSGCRTCVHPDRRTAPDPWNHRGASPSGSPSAWSSYISPLEEKPNRRINKVGKLLSINSLPWTHSNAEETHLICLSVMTGICLSCGRKRKGEKMDDSKRQFLHK